jgi:hypothetical protein
MELGKIFITHESNLRMPYQTCIFLFFTIFLIGETNAQKADLLSIKKIIESKFSVDLDTLDLCESTILNGVPFEKTEINAELKKLRLDEVLVTQLADLSASRLIHKNCSHIMVLGTGYNQSNEDKGKILDIIRTNLNTNVPKVRIHDYLCSQCRQVIIDGHPIGIYEAQRMVNELKEKDIKYIASYRSADPSVYGQNARNGLIEIYLTDKAKRNKDW